MSTVLSSQTPAGEPIAELRSEIEEIDGALVELLEKRVRVARRLALQKRSSGLPVLDTAREAVVVRRAGALAREAGLDEEAVRHIYWSIVHLTRRAQWEVE